MFLKKLINKTTFSVCIIIAITTLFSNCKNKELNKDQLIQSIIKDSLAYRGNYKKIVVLTDIGCPTCQTHLSEFIEESTTESEDVLYVINSSEKIVDLSHLRNNSKNIVFDNKKLFYNYNLVHGSAAFFIDNNGKIVETIPLDNPASIQENLSKIKD